MDIFKFCEGFMKAQLFYRIISNCCSGSYCSYLALYIFVDFSLGVKIPGLACLLSGGEDSGDINEKGVQWSHWSCCL